jgi:hypothetical protein
MEDLTTIIEDSITDAILPADPTGDSTPSDILDSTPVVESAPEAVVAPTAPTTEVSSPAAPKAPADDFDKRYGLVQNSPTGKENRIPYSRVKKIADNAVKDAKTSWQKDLETGYVPAAKFKELDTQVKTYQTQIADYEKVMVNEPVRFLQTLAQMPQYAAIFERLQAQAQPEAPAASVPDDMPQPDQELSDGSFVYSMEGVKALNAWNRAQAKKETMTEVESRIKAIEARYSGMEKDYNQHQTVQAILPKVEQQIADARTWPLFNESEAEIVKVLADNPKVNLERAYQQVVFPKLQANRDKMRADILREVKQAPRATSAPSSATRSNPVAPTGNRSLEDIIADSIKGLR